MSQHSSLHHSTGRHLNSPRRNSNVVFTWEHGQFALTISTVRVWDKLDFCPQHTLELQLSWLTGTATHPVMKKIRISGFLFENRLQWQFEVRKKSTNGCFRLNICLHTNQTLIRNSLYVIEKWGENLNRKKLQYSYSEKMFTRRTKPIRITRVRIRGILL